MPGELYSAFVLKLGWNMEAPNFSPQTPPNLCIHVVIAKFLP